MTELSKVMWRSVPAPATSAFSAIQKRFMNSWTSFSEGCTTVFEHARQNGVKVAANKWWDAHDRMGNNMRAGFYDNPKMGSYVDLNTGGSVTTRGTSPEEAFHSVINGVITGGQSCGVTMHALIVGRTYKFDRNKLCRLEGKPVGLICLNPILNNNNRALWNELCEVVGDPEAMEALNHSNPLRDERHIVYMDHRSNTFVGVYTQTKDTESIEQLFDDAICGAEENLDDDGDEEEVSK
jgi:hypothetical protein